MTPCPGLHAVQCEWAAAGGKAAAGGGALDRPGVGMAYGAVPPIVACSALPKLFAM